VVTNRRCQRFSRCPGAPRAPHRGDCGYSRRRQATAAEASSKRANGQRGSGTGRGAAGNPGNVGAATAAAAARCRRPRSTLANASTPPTQSRSESDSRTSVSQPGSLGQSRTSPPSESAATQTRVSRISPSRSMVWPTVSPIQRTCTGSSSRSNAESLTAQRPPGARNVAPPNAAHQLLRFAL